MFAVRISCGELSTRGSKQQNRLHVAHSLRSCRNLHLSLGNQTYPSRVSYPVGRAVKFCKESKLDLTYWETALSFVILNFVYQIFSTYDHRLRCVTACITFKLGLWWIRNTTVNNADTAQEIRKRLMAVIILYFRWFWPTFQLNTIN